MLTSALKISGQTGSSAENAVKTELAYIHVLKGNYEKAKSLYMTSSRSDSQNLDVLYGTIQCQIYLGEFRDAQDQLELLQELSTHTHKSAKLEFLSSLLAAYYRNDQDERVQHLYTAIELQIIAANSREKSVDYYIDINPDFMLECAKELVTRCGSTPTKIGTHGTQRIIRTY